MTRCCGHKTSAANDLRVKSFDGQFCTKIKFKNLMRSDANDDVGPDGNSLVGLNLRTSIAVLSAGHWF